MLLLFDVDGTLLLRAAEAHRDAMHAALTEVFGIRDPAAHLVEAPGRTDTAIARDIALLAGVATAAFDERLAQLRERAVAAFARLCPASLADRVAPGMPELLAGLALIPGVRLALLTGNYEPIARLKLARAGIGHHFAAGQGGFGSDAEARDELPAIARARAGAGQPHPRRRTLVIGDTPLDIACARADGVRVIAMATGPFGAEALRDADAVARDTAELDRLLQAELRSP